MDFYKEIACLEIGNNAVALSHLGDLIYSFSEVGYETQRSCEAICKFLEKRGFTVTSDIRGVKSTFRAEYGRTKVGNNEYANVAILCRYDAVPNRGHVKGTHLTAEAAVAAALGLKAVISSTAEKLGKVTVIGCPNQEGAALIPLLKLRAFHGLDIVLTAVPGSRTEWHPLYMGCKNFKALYFGSPEDPDKPKPASSALDASVIAYTKVLAMQEHFGKAWKAAGAIYQPGSISVDRQLCQTVVKLTAPDSAGLSFLSIRILPCLKSAASVTGCEVNITQGEYTIPNLISNIQLGYLLQLNAYHCGVLATPRKAPRSMPPTDVAEVSRVIPTIRPIFYIGTDESPGTQEFKEASKTQTAHHYTLAMAKALAMTAIDVLHTPGALAKVKDDLKKALAEESKIKFLPFPTNQPQNDQYLVKTDLPSDLGFVGWAKTT